MSSPTDASCGHHHYPRCRLNPTQEEWKGRREQGCGGNSSDVDDDEGDGGGGDGGGGIGPGYTVCQRSASSVAGGTPMGRNQYSVSILRIIILVFRKSMTHTVQTSEEINIIRKSPC